MPGLRDMYGGGGQLEPGEAVLVSVQCKPSSNGGFLNNVLGWGTNFACNLKGRATAILAQFRSMLAEEI
jgi:hypothetical protein